MSSVYTVASMMSGMEKELRKNVKCKASLTSVFNMLPLPDPFSPVFPFPLLAIAYSSLTCYTCVYVLLLEHRLHRAEMLLCVAHCYFPNAWCKEDTPC